MSENLKIFSFYFIVFFILFSVYAIVSQADDANKEQGLNITPIERLYIEYKGK